jgi:hypothetical protein
VAAHARRSLAGALGRTNPLLDRDLFIERALPEGTLLATDIATAKRRPSYTVFHVLLAVVGVYNLISAFAYVFNRWVALHDQGIGHAYLAYSLLLFAPWFILIVMVCFLGNWLMPKPGRPVTSKAVATTLFGVLVSLVAPFFMVLAWRALVVPIRRAVLWLFT